MQNQEKKQKSNVVFFITIVFSYFIALKIPDFDLGIFSFLGHRSIVTHSILIPYLFYYYFIKKKQSQNELFKILTIGLFLGFGVHLSADLIPKKWIGTALITVLGIRLPDFISILWIFANAFFCLKFALNIFLTLSVSNFKKYFFYIFSIFFSFIYFYNDNSNYKDYENNPYGQKFLIFILIYFLVFIFSKKKENIKKKKSLFIKYSFFSFKTFLLGLFALFIIILLVENLSDKSSNTISTKNFFIPNNETKEIQKNIPIKPLEINRHLHVHEDEYELCKKNIIKNYSEVKFVRFNVVNSEILKNHFPLKKNIKMQMDQEASFLNTNFGIIDCLIIINQNQSISFDSLKK